METDTTAAPFGDFVIRLLTAGPAVAGAVPRSAMVRDELRLAWGVHGERVRTTWLAHETWLRAAAAARGIRPTFRGQFFGEAIAAQKGNQR